MKRIIDFCFSVLGIILLIPIFLPMLILVFLQDFHSPFYIAKRVGKDEKLFHMIKIRSMIKDVHKTGVQSTSSDDNRITWVGKIIRKLKLDELSQLFNVLIGNMSLVGPRPNVLEETELYTHIERKLLSVTPGITDFSSIIFADEGEILKDSNNPDLDYNQLIRPWKSRLGLFYIENRSNLLDFWLIAATLVSILNRRKALNMLSKKLESLNASEDLIAVSKRVDTLIPQAPPGMNDYVKQR